MREPGRRYAFAAFIAALLAVTGLVLMTLDYERAAGIGSGTWTLRGVIVVGGLYGIPLGLAAAAVVGPARVATALRWASAVVLFLLVPLFAFAGGLFFLPAASLMLVSAIQSGRSIRSFSRRPLGSELTQLGHRSGPPPRLSDSLPRAWNFSAQSLPPESMGQRRISAHPEGGRPRGMTVEIAWATGDHERCAPPVPSRVVGCRAASVALGRNGGTLAR